MKNTVRSIRGLAFASVASLGLIAMTPAVAESDFDTGNGALSASAELDFRVIIPRFIDFRVGTDGAGNVDLVEFDVAAANVGDGGQIARTNGGVINVELVSNVGDITLGATGPAAGLSGGGNTIPWTQITGTSSNAAGFPVPGVNAAASTLTATNGVIDRTADWTFVYENDNVYAAGTYDGTVTYTASAP